MGEHEIRIVPHDTEAERAVLSSMLFDKDALVVAVELLRKQDFYSPAHAEVFDACAELFGQNQPVDLVTVKDKLFERALLDQIGGLPFLSELAASYFTSAYVRRYASIVYEKSLLRRLISSANEISAMAYRGEQAQHVLDFAEKSIMNLSKRVNTPDFTHMRDVLCSVVDDIEETVKRGERVSGVESGFQDLDSMTTGFKPSDLVLIAARPSMGKTAFALNIAQHAAVRRGTTVAVFSLEMSKEQLGARMLCSQAGVDSNKLRSGELDDDDWGRILEALTPLANAPIYINDISNISHLELRSMCRRLKLEKDLGMIVIDYLQLMNGAGRTESRQQEISEISRALKGIAREMSVPVIALSQLSRAPEQRKEHRPILSDLRESGAIEQDADLVTFLYREERYDEFTEDKGIAEVIIAKQRNGPTGTVRLRWLDKYTKFTNLEH